MMFIQEAEQAREEKEAALEELKLAQEMVEEMINSQNNNQSDDKLLEVLNQFSDKLLKVLN